MAVWHPANLLSNDDILFTTKSLAICVDDVADEFLRWKLTRRRFTPGFGQPGDDDHAGAFLAITDGHLQHKLGDDWILKGTAQCRYALFRVRPVTVQFTRRLKAKRRSFKTSIHRYISTTPDVPQPRYPDCRAGSSLSTATSVQLAQSCEKLRIIFARIAAAQETGTSHPARL
ncbi:uncharacterized protein DSM5745_07149 [Aspergillus mulundensis]|uniref:Uncharacterized protein n=1 Tax=Aspergillus mulundensis TaxID=1810919 RepID=A0A3D8RKA7_9EURO|nr:hypothetical protein DSM5745_07149 [Aspergillus mulundensis]RDW74487.1 hypothetical protein DSM5745_07149 [Aspergillus mulundensis]